MLYAILSDWHGINPNRVREEIGNDYDVFISLGDYDLASTLNGWMEWERELKTRGKKVISLPGNHDHGILYKTSLGFSRFSTYHAKNPELGEHDYVDTHYLYQKIAENPKLRNYFIDLVEGQKESCFLLDSEKHPHLKGIACHGALNGDLSSFGDIDNIDEFFQTMKKSKFPEDVSKIVKKFGLEPEIELVLREFKNSQEVYSLWSRLKDGSEHHQRNFFEMRNKGYNLMFRGHDHYFSFEYMGENEEVHKIHLNIGKEIELPRDKLITITVGALCKGHYVTVDTNHKQPQVKYCWF